MSGYRLAARLARREVRHRPGRTALVALLVAFPVAAMTCAAVLVRTEHLTPMQSWHQWYGQADMVNNSGDASLGNSPTPNPLDAIVAQSHVVDYRTAYGPLLRTVDRHRSRVTVSDLPMVDPTTRGIMRVTSGRAPVAPGEVFLTRTAARQLHVRRGEVLHLERPARLDLTVVGIGERAASWGEADAVVARGTPYPWPTSDGSSERTSLVAFPTRAMSHVRALIAQGASGAFSPAIVPQRDHLAAVDANKKVRWSWVIGAVALTVVGIVIAAAFAAGARRQLVTLGQLAANGAPPRTLRRTLFLQGTWTGIVGALTGLALAAGVLAALAPHIERVLGHDVGGYRVRAADLVPIVLLGIAAATIAALVPARTSTRVPVLAALSGRRPLGRVPRWLPVAGMLVVGGGLALLGLAVVGANGTQQGNQSQVWALTAIVGGVAILLGACAIAPAYVSVLEPIATRLRGAARLATRSLARQRTRTAAVVSAVAATTALAIAVSALVLSARTDEDRQALYVRDTDVQLTSYEPATAPPARVVDAVAKTLPDARRYDVQLVQSARPLGVGDAVLDKPELAERDATFVNIGEPAGVADRDLLAVLQLSSADRSHLDHDGVLVFAVGSGRADAIVDAKSHPVALADEKHYSLGSLPHVVITPRFAREHGYTTPASRIVVLRSPHVLTADQRDDLQEVIDDTFNTRVGQNLNVEYYQPTDGVDPLLIDEILVGVALALVLFVVAVNLALSAAETREERDVLAVVGASPATTRRTNGYKAALVTLLGTALAIPVGFLPVVVFVVTHHHHELPLVFPWRLAAALVIGVPVIAGLVTTAGSALALWARPVRVSKMAFD